MSSIHLPTLEELPDDVWRLIEAAQKDLRLPHIPNVALAMAADPELFRASRPFQAASMQARGVLDRATVELLSTVVSAANVCDY